LLWAEYNLGAEPGDMASDWYGDNYAWGETEIKSDYSWKSYTHCDKREKLIKYNTNYNSKEAVGLSKLKSQDDVVSVTLGKPCRMPTKKELNELLKYTTHEWVTDYNGVNKLNGMLFISKNNNNTLFFPASVYFNNTFTDDMIYLGYIWSSSLYTEDPYTAVNLYFDKDTIGFIHSLRCYGYSIRAVKK